MAKRGWSRRTWAAVGLAATGLVTGAALVAYQLASPVFGLRQGPLADDPQCARIADHYPDRLAGNRRDPVTFDGLAVWGRGAVQLRCGLEPPGPSTDLCVTVNGVDWVLQETRSRDGRQYLISYGRRPAVEVSMADSVTRTDAVLVEMSRLVAPVPQSAKCLSTNGT